MYLSVYDIPNTEVIKQAVYAVCRFFEGENALKFDTNNKKYRVFNEVIRTVIWTGNHVLKFFLLQSSKKNISLHCFLLGSCNVKKIERKSVGIKIRISIPSCVCAFSLPCYFSKTFLVSEKNSKNPSCF